MLTVRRKGIFRRRPGVQIADPSFGSETGHKSPDIAGRRHQPLPGQACRKALICTPPRHKCGDLQVIHVLSVFPDCTISATIETLSEVTANWSASRSAA
jgi:hypothetical protein